jgi:tripartite-type tricarboxylate transporter receptor subunit TctC
VKTLEGAFRKAMETPEFITYAKGNYVYVENPLSGQDLQEYLEVRYPKIGDVIRKIKGK